jgi:hypothetical protein
LLLRLYFAAHERAERFALNANARELPLIQADPYLNNLPEILRGAKPIEEVMPVTHES